MTGVQAWRALVLMAAISVHSGCCFLFKRSDDDNPDKVAHLRSRYWNDDIQPCIEKYCLPYASAQRIYIKCLQHYCPAGLLTVPDRDVDDIAPLVEYLANTEFCAAKQAPALVPVCKPGRCDILVGADSNADPATIFKYGVYNMCRAIMCGEVSGSQQESCVQEKCCGQSSNSGVASRKRALSLLRASNEDVMTRKRRVNDEVAQCMQSYCSGLYGRGHFDCIYRKCNRAY